MKHLKLLKNILWGFAICYSIAISACTMPTSNTETSNPEKSDNNGTVTDNSSQSTSEDYSGTYYDLDANTGWETTVVISGNTFEAKTINTQTGGDVVASGSGKLNNDNLIDENGQNIGSVSKYSLELRFGSASITCQKR